MPQKILVVFLCLSVSHLAQSQISLFGGSMSGGIESNAALYNDGSFGSNNYLKLDYVKGRFSVGTQLEWYPVPLLGYNPELKGFGVPGKYIAWADETWDVTLGDYYEQFGTGLVLRSWEDRNLGWNNSIGGARVFFRTLNDLFSAKALVGVPRKALCYADGLISGVSAAFQWKGFSMEGNFVDRLEHGTHLFSWSVLPSYAIGGFAVKGEYARLGMGNAQTVEMEFAARGFSASVTLRRLDGMDDPFSMHYLPALCQEQSYMLASLNPYKTYAKGEAGGVADVYYRWKSLKFHVNGSMIYSLPKTLKNYDCLRLCYRDINIEVEKKWNSRIKTTAFVSIQEKSPSYGDRIATDAQNVFVLDGLFRIGRMCSLRAQVQYLYSQELTRDWMASLLEFGWAPHWSVYTSDKYNHGDTKEHYYEAGVSYTWSSLKIALSYGHQRAGYVCSGGVCRWQPEYTGGLLRVNYAF